MKSDSHIEEVQHPCPAPDKWVFFYEYARKALDEDIQRFQIIDQKAIRFLTLISVVIGAFSGVVPWAFDNNFPPSGWLSWALSIVLILAFLCLAAAWSMLYRSIKLANVPRMPLNDQVDNLFWDSSLPHIYYMLTKTCRKALDVNRSVIDKKGEFMRSAYALIAASAWLVVSSVVLIVILKLLE